MALTDDEQRILDGIERDIHASDARLARQLATGTPRRAKLGAQAAAGGFLVGFALLIASYIASTFVALGGFGLMLACALVCERSARTALGRRRERSVHGDRNEKAKVTLGGRLDRLRSRFGPQ